MEENKTEMKRRDFLKCAGKCAGLCGAAGLSGGAAVPAERRPGVMRRR